MPITYTLREIADATGAKPRALQFWTLNGVLQPVEGTMHGGSGRHRRYARAEVELAAVLNELHVFTLSVGTLRSLADYLRDTITTGDRLGFTSPREADEAAQSVSVRYVADSSEGNEAFRATLLEQANKFPQFALSIDDARALERWARWGFAREGQDLWLSLNIRDDGSWRAGFGQKPGYVWNDESGAKDVWRRLIAIDIAAILRSLWG
jgi:DNA-binding transcriptional MerR regulator